MKKVSGVRFVGTLFLTLCCVLAMIPLFLGIMRSLFRDSAFTQFNFFSSYLTVIRSEAIVPAFFNSILITMISVPLNVGIVSLAAYGFSKFHFKGKNFFYLIEVAYGTTFNLLMLKNYFDGIPNELLEAAKIDGAGTMRVLWSILLPVAKPAMFVIILWSFLGSWNDYLWPLLFFLDSSKKTVTLLPKYFTSTYTQQYDNIFAALFLIMLPIVILYCCLQKYFQQGVVSGAVKA